jgi:hypothetical protein
MGLVIDKRQFCRYYGSVQTTPVSLLLNKACNLPGAIMDWVKDTFDEAGFEGAKIKFKESLPEDWHSAARTLLVELEKAELRLIFIFDELPSMLEKICEKSDDNEARSFLAWFRAVRMLRKGRLRRHLGRSRVRLVSRARPKYQRVLLPAKCNA